jgi:hypothetical protein
MPVGSAEYFPHLIPNIHPRLPQDNEASRLAITLDGFYSSRKAEMQIAPGISSNDWNALDLDCATSPDWAAAVDIFERRIRERYIEPIDHLIAVDLPKRPAERRFGFAILGLDCLVVETLSAFIEGLEDTEGKSKRVFRTFMRTRTRFKNIFTTDEIADQFYKEFRCGILHQAEVGGESKVWSVGPLLQISGKGFIVNRDEFHACVKGEFEDYLTELRDPSNVILRENFRRKMDFIARM